MELTPEELQFRIATLKKSTLFKLVTDDHLEPLAKKMVVKVFPAGDDIHPQGVPHKNVFFVLDGQVVRLVQDKAGVTHQMEPPSKEDMVFGSLHVISEKISLAKFHCLTEVHALVLHGDDIQDSFANAEFSRQVAQSLCMDILLTAGKFRTPMLDQQSRKINFLATTVAASLESFYRSALNSVLNRRLTKVAGPLFPDMHVQIVSRVLYINGLKGIRQFFSTYDVTMHPYPEFSRLLIAMAPGLIMCPVSSMLEATNAHLNKESLATKWRRGYWPRCVREIIFAMGLNQMSDYWTERIPDTMVKSTPVKAAAGSLIAGVISGYFSHVPHNLATMKLMDPTKSYGTLFGEFAKRSEARVPSFVPPFARSATASLLSVLAPVGVHIRTTQIVGSFVLLNGLIASLS